MIKYLAFEMWSWAFVNQKIAHRLRDWKRNKKVTFFR